MDSVAFQKQAHNSDCQSNQEKDPGNQKTDRDEVVLVELRGAIRASPSRFSAQLKNPPEEKAADHHRGRRWIFFLREPDSFGSYAALWTQAWHYMRQ